MDTEKASKAKSEELNRLFDDKIKMEIEPLRKDLKAIFEVNKGFINRHQTTIQDSIKLFSPDGLDSKPSAILAIMAFQIKTGFTDSIYSFDGYEQYIHYSAAICGKTFNILSDSNIFSIKPQASELFVAGGDMLHKRLEKQFHELINEIVYENELEQLSKYLHENILNAQKDIRSCEMILNNAFLIVEFAIQIGFLSKKDTETEKAPEQLEQIPEEWLPILERLSQSNVTIIKSQLYNCNGIEYDPKTVKTYTSNMSKLGLIEEKFGHRKGFSITEKGRKYCK